MLTIEYILKIGRLLDQTGPPRPGFLDDEKANLEGQSTGLEMPILAAAPPLRDSALDEDRAIILGLKYVVDTKSGDVRVVRT